ncbi:MAG: ABC transporter ATP-binding protein [candidate division Zixibacteria bacterium]|nr:ABC transporter ATP-binding protein [candidate division Zixibacteria bacterium]
MNIIEICDLTKIFHTRLMKGNVVALDTVSLDIHQGEVFGLLGPNGSGKTTLVKNLLGICSPTSGTIRINGLPPSDPLSREKIGFLGENYRFPLHLTGLELLMFAGRLHGLPESQTEGTAQQLLLSVGMERWSNTKISRYSKGMTQRVGLAQAMLSDPDLIILDEPTDGIDPIGRVEFRHILERLRNQGKTILLNSHLLSEVESVADRVAILSKGKLMRLGTVSELTNHKNQYRIEAALGEQQFDVPTEMGRRVSITSTDMVVELNDIDDINYIIDHLRIRKIAIKTITPVKVTLEQTFMDTLTVPQEQSV